MAVNLAEISPSSSVSSICEGAASPCQIWGCFVSKYPDADEVSFASLQHRRDSFCEKGRDVQWMHDQWVGLFEIECLPCLNVSLRDFAVMQLRHREQYVRV